MRRYVLPIFLLGLILLPALSLAQTYEEKMARIRQEQEQKRAEINMLEARIRSYQQRVNQTEEEYDKIYSQYQNLNNLIALQDDKISSLEQEQMQIMTEISITEEEIDMREDELQELIENYKKIILYAYKNGRSTNLELLLTSASLNQMVVRSFYLKKFEEQKAKQAEVIRTRKEELSDFREQLEDSHDRNQELISEIRLEKDELGEQRQQQAETVETLQQERSRILEELRKARRAKEELDNLMNELFTDAESLRESERDRIRKLEAARQITDPTRRASEVAKYITPESGISEDQLNEYSSMFSSARGSLNWPVESRTISKAFGNTRNPLYGTTTPHPGIDIVTNAGEQVRAVSDGYVDRITTFNEYGDVVLVSHGNYYTVYGNLSDIFVSSGTVLRSGDIIGLSGNSETPMGEVLFFSIRREQQWVDPITWLTPRN